MGLSVLLLPSPLLPATAYGGLAAALVRSGVMAAIGPSELATGEHASDLVRRWAELITTDTVLVPHSNAGYLAPIVRADGGGARPIVFMDAALPPEAGTAPLAPPQFRAFVAGLADEEGLLPPWTRWWPRTVLADVIPADDFDGLDSACPRLPLSYFDSRVSSPDAWADRAAAYLAFGRTYAEELSFAVTHGWPNTRLDGLHLHFMHDPDAVATEILRLAADLQC